MKDLEVNFMKRIKVEEDKEEKRLLKLQDEFRKGNIQEEEMTKEDIEKLHILYNKQIEEIEQSIENYKQETLKIMREIKKKTG